MSNGDEKAKARERLRLDLLGPAKDGLGCFECGGGTLEFWDKANVYVKGFCLGFNGPCSRNKPAGEDLVTYASGDRDGRTFCCPRGHMTHEEAEKHASDLSH